MYGTGAVTAPLYAYWHADPLDSSDRCPRSGGGSSVTGLAFYQRSKGVDKYAAKYDGALFFVDYARNCIAALLPTNGIPDKTKLEVIGQNTEQPVDITQGPEGDLYYVDFNGKVMRLRYLTSPVARATVTPAHSRAPVDVTLDGSTSVDPNSDLGCHIEAWNWDTDNDGNFDNESGVSVSVHIDPPDDYPMKLQVRSSCNDLTGTSSFTVFANNAPPVPEINTPSACDDPDNGCWKVGDKLSFSGSASDPEDGNVPASKFRWDLIIEHCPGGFGSACHEHFPGTVSGKASGSFTAPDHAYPSYLRLKLTATDSKGVQGSTFINLYPETSDVHAASSPSGAKISIGSATQPAPWTGQVITGGRTGLSAALTRTVSGQRYRFSTWNDSHTRSRTISVSTDKTFIATYVPDAPDRCGGADTNSPKRTDIKERSSGNSDDDWFQFHIKHKHEVRITLKDLPVRGRLDLYHSCSNHLDKSNNGGKQDERIKLTLAKGTYRIRVTSPNNGWSSKNYTLRIQPL